MTAAAVIAAGVLAAARLAVLAPVARPTAAEDDLGALRLAGCAALWQAQAEAFGDDDGSLRALAGRFEDAAAARAGEAEAAALVAERRPWMADLIAAYVLRGDDQSRDLYERLLGDCAAMEGGGLLP